MTHAGQAAARRLLEVHRLWVDPFTADYIASELGRGQAEVTFIGACARTGRSDLHTLAAAELMGEAVTQPVAPPVREG